MFIYGKNTKKASDKNKMLTFLRPARYVLHTVDNNLMYIVSSLGLIVRTHHYK
jgi:hypothetical protein